MQSQQSLGRFELEAQLQPGSSLELQGETYVVLERRHRYQYRQGRYCLGQILLYVNPATPTMEKTWVGGRWVLGDASCRFNARSPLLRCAINPQGPCAGCVSYLNG